MRFRFFSFKFHLLVYGLLLVAGTIIFRVTDLDLAISDLWYFRRGHWISIEHPFWGPVYKLLTGPNIITLFIALMLLLYAVVISKNHKIKWSALCVVIAIILGPGLLVNGTLKPLMGRPRPYVIERYDGSEKFVKVLDVSDLGKSFPSGHAASGFVLTILFYVFYRDRKKLAWIGWFSGLGLGTLLSIGRIIQGGHFASDNLWAFGITQLVNCSVYFGLQSRIRQKQDHPIRSFSQAPTSSKIVATGGISLLTVLFVVGFLINFPFTFHQYTIAPIPQNINHIVIDADLEDDQIKLFKTTNHSLGIDHLAFANGFPWSHVEARTKKTIEGNTLIYTIRIDRSGAFRDYRGRVKIYLPENAKIDFSKMKGEVVENQGKFKVKP